MGQRAEKASLIQLSTVEDEHLGHHTHVGVEIPFDDPVAGFGSKGLDDVEDDIGLSLDGFHGGLLDLISNGLVASHLKGLRLTHPNSEGVSLVDDLVNAFLHEVLALLPDHSPVLDDEVGAQILLH